MSTSGSMDDLSAIVTRLSKELELMGLPGLASSYQQVDYNSSDGASIVVGQLQEDVISDLISSSYDLIGLLRDLQRSKRQREDHAQQLIHDLQRSQWLLDKEKELSVQREREAAEAYEKERQANVRLQLSETLLKKKSEEHRQLAHECQLKENQWLHALRRRDQENHRLHQQLLKFLHTKSTGSPATGIVPLQVEMRGSLVAPARASDSTRLRKQWDRTAAVDDTQKLVEAKWKMALNSLEKDHQLLRNDYVQLVDMLGRFLTNCSAKLAARRPATNQFLNITEWIQLPVVSMRDRLEQVFRLVEDGLVSTTFSHNHMETGQSFLLAAPNSFEMDYVMPIVTNQIITKPSEPTAAHQLLPALENQKVAAAVINNCVSPIIKDEVVDGVMSSRSGISTTTNSSTAAQQRQPFKMVKSPAVQHSTSTTTTTGHQFDRLAATDDDDPYSGYLSAAAFRKAARGNESPSQVVNQVDWNEVKMPDNRPAALRTVYNMVQDTVMSRQSTSGTALSVSEFSKVTDDDDDDDDVKLDETYVNDEMATLDTPCPSASNSRSASSSSSTSSLGSWKSQKQLEGIDPTPSLGGATGGVDEQFFRACSDAASLVSRDSRIRTLSGPSISAGPTTTLNLNRKTITAKVSFIQATTSTASATNNVALATPSAHHSGDPVDLRCCLISTPRINNNSSSSVDT